MKLLSMVVFYKAQYLKFSKGKIPGKTLGDAAINLAKICRFYADFLLKKLELWMFVPCDRKGNALTKPKKYGHFLKYGSFGTIKGRELSECIEYKQGEDRVLFEGFEVVLNFEKERVLKMNGSGQVYSYIDRYGEFTVTYPKTSTIEGLVGITPTLTKSATKPIEV